MSEEKTLDEKTLEGVAGGDRVDLRQGGRCESCALDGAACPYYYDWNTRQHKIAGEEICEKYVPRT